MPVASIRPGTTRNPPPIPKNPDSVPAPTPTPSSFGRLPRLSRTPASPSPPRLRSIRTPTTSISTANSASSRCPSISLPRVDPARAPAAPVAAKTLAHGHFTVPRRAWFTRPMAAFAATATALVPIARWVSPTPTR